MQTRLCLQPSTDMPLAGTSWNCAQQPVISNGGNAGWRTGMALPVGRLSCSNVQQHRPAQPRQHTVHARRRALVRPARRTLPSCSAAAATGELLMGDLMYDSYDEEVFEPSHDLRELASAQLRSMFQVLSRLSTSAAAGSGSSSSTHPASSCRACVYARRAESLGASQIRLQRVACWPGAAAQQPHGSSSTNSSYEEMDDVLTLQRPAWEAGSGSSGTCDTEASLCQEDVLLLPNSNMIVMPLAEAGVLVGLLVVEVPGLPVRSPSSSSMNAPASPWDPPPSSSQMGLPEEALWCFRMAVPPLAKACAMDLRAALAGAQQEAQQRLARSLLLEAQGPLKVLGTFGQMLAPRLRSELAGQPESDMADGMVMQGQRLADVVAQLEAALRPQAGSRGPGQQQLALPAGAEPAAAGAVVPGMGMPGVAYDSFDDIEDIDLPDVWHTHDQRPVQQQEQQQQVPQQQQQQQQQVKGLPSGMTTKAGYLPEHISSSSSAASSSAAVQPSSSQQQELPHMPGQGTAGSLGSSSRDIRWGRVEPPAAAATTSVDSSSSSSSSKDCSASYSVAPGQLDMATTLDLEVVGAEGTAMSMDADSGSSSSSNATAVTAPSFARSNRRSSSSSDRAESSNRMLSSSSSSSSSRRSFSKRAAAASGVALQPPASCNLIDTICHLLTAAANLAMVEGKHFIVSPPLLLDQPLSPPASSSSSSSAAPALLPRPIRPLLVGLAAGTCRRVLGYVLDVALQCTPRGGQLCVTARESSGGVEVSLLHTGQVQASRVHTTSKALSPAIHNSSSALLQQQLRTTTTISSSSSSSSKHSTITAAVGGASSAQRSSGSSRRSRRAVQELSSSGISRSSSSSLVSLDFAGQVLQEIGGRLAVVYPIQFINAVSGNLEVGSSIQDACLVVHIDDSG
ncbi:hypothetical protein COO60DRAFT_1700755 [Scenedesmus sp. NREL 46B-D3]|nr:hypothetical protein COO60DRAFT_1700755 [Scenedesmus sp. NREL 46B-D3]